jgi:hypothetical protein
MTFLIKWMLPVLWMVGGGVGLGSTWCRGFEARSGHHPLGSAGWGLLALWCIGSGLLARLGWRIKRVQVDEHALHVSNYWSEVQVPFREISHLTECAWFVPRTVTVHLQRRSAFGDRIVFIPKGWIPVGPHPVIVELLRLSNAARDRERG